MKSEKELALLIRTIYADAVEQEERTKEKLRDAVSRGDIATMRLYKAQLHERERAENRIRSICLDHGFDPVVME